MGECNTTEIRETVLYDICSSAIDGAGCAEKNKAIEDLCAEVERLRGRIEDYKDACIRRDELIAGGESEIERLREALEAMRRTASQAHAHERPGWECAECNRQSWDDVADAALHTEEVSGG